VQNAGKYGGNISVNIRRFVGWLLAMAICATVGVASDSLTYLRENPTACPKKVILKEPVTFSLILDGKTVGSVSKPAQSEVDVVSYHDSKLEVISGNARATVEPGQTDLLERVEQVRAKLAEQPVPTPTPTVPSPAAVSVVATKPSPASPADAVVPSPATGTPSTYESGISPKANFTKAEFRLRLLGTQPVKGILVLVPGLDGDGRGAVESGRWQALAREFDLALVGCFMQGGGYHQAENGTGEALLDALKDFAKQSKHPELNTVPLVMWGHSAGGQFNYNFVSWKPQRVAAFIVNKGGYYSGQPNGQSRKVPGLFFLGTKDTELRINSITGIYERGRKLGALWALAPEANAGHEEGRTQEVANTFFKAILPHRLSSSGKLEDVEERTGWLAAPEKKIIEPAATSKLTKSEAGWLPDEATAKAWLSLVGGN